MITGWVSLNAEQQYETIQTGDRRKGQPVTHREGRAIAGLGEANCL